MMDSNHIIIKSPTQIAGIRKSCQLAKACLKMIEEFVVEGVTTQELDEIIDHFIVQHKATSACRGYHHYPAATCISVNEAICHGIPNNYKLKNGDILNIDVTTVLDGYYGDTSTMYTVGEISPESQKLLKVTKECLEIGIQQVKPGNWTGNIGYWVENHATKNGCSTVRDLCGHGVGLFFHEPPEIPFFGKKYTGVRLLPGMTITIEPMVCLGHWKINKLDDGWTIVTADGKRSAQYEETVLVTESGCEILR
jgi:methionyl aminopeptidase